MDPRVIIAKLRLKLNRVLTRLLLGKYSGNLDRSVIRSLLEMSGQRIVNDVLMEARKIAAAEVIQYAFPDTFPAWFRREKAFDTKNMYILKNAVISPFSGMIWLPKGYVLQESVGSLGRIIGWGGYCTSLCLLWRKTRLKKS